MQAMMAGDLDVAYVGAAPVLTALSQGLDAKIVEPVQINGSSLVLRPEYKYESPKDLKGLNIATYPPGSIQDTLLREWLKENGLDPEKDVTIRGNDSRRCRHRYFSQTGRCRLPASPLPNSCRKDRVTGVPSYNLDRWNQTMPAVCS